MFQVMEKLGMPTIYIKMVRMLFHDANVSININNQVTNPFELHKVVCQGCLLAPICLLLREKSLMQQ